MVNRFKCVIAIGFINMAIMLILISTSAFVVFKHFAQSVASQAGEDLHKPCGTVFTDMTSSDPATYSIARGIVFAAINEKLQLPVDRHPDTQMLAKQLVLMKSLCDKTPEMPMSMFLRVYIDNNTSGKSSDYRH
jgi:hypothetical protein